jgi:osmotically-inducible protein OsmY
MSVRKLFSALVLAVAIAGLSQAAPVAKPNAVAAKLPDAQIERNIRAKFLKSKINADHFTVTVQNGIATIEGKTNVIQHKGVATRLARTGGAQAVQNRIQISEEARAKAAAKLAKARSGGDTPPAKAVVIPPTKSK